MAKQIFTPGDIAYVRYIGSNPKSYNLDIFETEVLSTTKLSFECDIEGRVRKFKYSDMRVISKMERDYKAYFTRANYENEQNLKRNRIAIAAKLSEMTFEQSCEILKILCK